MTDVYAVSWWEADGRKHAAGSGASTDKPCRALLGNTAFQVQHHWGRRQRHRSESRRLSMHIARFAQWSYSGRCLSNDSNTVMPFAVPM